MCPRSMPTFDGSSMEVKLTINYQSLKIEVHAKSIVIAKISNTYCVIYKGNTYNRLYSPRPLGYYACLRQAQCKPTLHAVVRG